MTAEPAQVWWTAEEIAAAALPELPATKRKVNALADRLGWRGRAETARRRAGRGGGWEYHWTLFPRAAQKRLLGAGRVTETTKPRMDREGAWAWFEGLPDAVKAKARMRLDLVGRVEALERLGQSRLLAVRDVAQGSGCGARTIWNWLGAIAEVRPEDRLPYLAPRHRATKRGGPQGACDPKFRDMLFSEYLRSEQPSFTACYRRAARVAREKGWATLPERTMRRRLEAEVSHPSRILARKGFDALKAAYPPQIRDKTGLHAMEAVNADFHRFDVFVRWPAAPGSNEAEIVRPQLVAFQDIFSGRLLSWRVDRTPNKSAVALALGDMIEAWGIPEHVLLDNGREFANKFLTGQAQTRHRFKIKDDDIPGVLKTLDVQIHWATPYAGQSKPIERAFRDLCDSIAKDPRFAGAYTGNRPDAKPENYASKAVPLERFLEVVAEGIEEHNARPGRRTVTADGRSFAATFEASYATAPVRKATDAQRRLWLMGAEGLMADRKTGRISLMGNTYWAEWLHEIAGARVVARFDPADLRAGLHVYALSGEYLGHAPCQVAAGFFDLEEARLHSARRRAWMKAERAALEAHRKMTLAEIGAHLDAARPEAAAVPVEAKVVRPVFGKAKPPAAAPERPEDAAEHAALIAEFEARRAASAAPAETEHDRFRRALRLEEDLAAGRAVPREAVRALSVYQNTPEYRGLRDLYDDFGDSMFGA